jgi:hypothetical protein
MRASCLLNACLCLLAAISPAGMAQSTVVPAPAATILPDNTVRSAEIAALQEEIRAFDTVRQGILLSLGLCDLTETCQPVVSHEELRRLASAVDHRIEQLVMRHADTQDAELETVLIAYADLRDSFNAALAQLNAVSPEPVRKLTFADALGGTENELMPPEYAVFEDAGEELLDDGDAPPEAPADAPLEAPAADPQQ